MNVRPCELAVANAFVAQHHRHHQPVQGHRFSLSAWDGDTLVGVAVVGRPVARMAGSPLEVAEVTRLCTDGTPNACSALYGAAARVAREMGFARIQTYILDSEAGTSLKASGWVNEGEAGGGQWKHTDGRPRRTDQPTALKQRWVRHFHPSEARAWPAFVTETLQAELDLTPAPPDDTKADRAGSPQRGH